MNRNLKVGGFLRAFEDRNGRFDYNILIVNTLSEYSKYSEKCVRHVFLSVLKNFVFV